jgi:hypothetical protein
MDGERGYHMKKELTLLVMFFVLLNNNCEWSVSL